MKLWQSILLNMLLVAALLGFALATLCGMAKEQHYNQSQTVIKCQEGWQFYCRKLVNGKAAVGE